MTLVLVGPADLLDEIEEAIRSSAQGRDVLVTPIRSLEELAAGRALARRLEAEGLITMAEFRGVAN